MLSNQEQALNNPEQILATSGESFFWARRFLGKKMGHDAAILYSFCRVLDDMADGDILDGPEQLVKIQTSLENGCCNTTTSSSSCQHGSSTICQRTSSPHSSRV